MAGDNDNAVLRPRKFGDDVVNRELSFRSIGGESIILDAVALQMREDVILEFLMICAPNWASTEGDHFADVVHGAAGIKV